MNRVQIIDGASDFEIAAWLERRLAQALAQDDGLVSVTIPGGSTPFPILAELARAQLDWPRIESGRAMTGSWQKTTRPVMSAGFAPHWSHWERRSCRWQKPPGRRILR